MVQPTRPEADLLAPSELFLTRVSPSASSRSEVGLLGPAPATRLRPRPPASSSGQPLRTRPRSAAECFPPSFSRPAAGGSLPSGAEEGSRPCLACSASLEPPAPQGSRAQARTRCPIPAAAGCAARPRPALRPTCPYSFSLPARQVRRGTGGIALRRAFLIPRPALPAFVTVFQASGEGIVTVTAHTAAGPA